MADTTPVYFHIGYPKTGTTALQGEVFPRAEGLHVWANGGLGFPTNWTTEQEQAVLLLRDLVWSDEWRGDGHAADELRRLAAPGDGQTSFASYESLAGLLYYPDNDGRRTCRRLHELFPAARVILVIREQRSMLRSAYAQYVRAGGTVSPARFPQSDACHLDRLLYDRFVDDLCHELGADNVKVLVYEELLRSPGTFLDELGAFVGVGDLAGLAPQATRTRNASFSAISIAAKRLTNRLFRVSDLQPRPILASRRLTRYGIASIARLERVLAGRPKPPEVRLPTSFVASIATSNAALSTRCDLRLDEYGYLLPDRDPQR